jgi:hypothetical protein
MKQLLDESATKSPPVCEARRAAGKKSEAGRKASSQNARKHGYYVCTFTVLPTERQEKFDALRHGLLDQMQPSNDRQFRLLEQIVKNHWLLWRNYSYEDAALSVEIQSQFNQVVASGVKPPGTKNLNYFAFDALAQRNGTLVLIYRLRAQLNRELARDYKQYDQFKKLDAATAKDAAIPPLPDFGEDDMFQPPAPSPEPAPESASGPQPSIENSKNEGNAPEPEPEPVPQPEPEPEPEPQPTIENSRNEGNSPVPEPEQQQPAPTPLNYPQRE